MSDQTFNESDDIDALSLLGCDADEHAMDAAITEKAFRGLAELVGAFEKVSQHQRQIHGAEALIEQLRRLAHIMEDYYAAHPKA